LTQALRQFADDAGLAKASAMALWSIAFKNVELKVIGSQSSVYY
jgi:hypothetical protein